MQSPPTFQTQTPQRKPNNGGYEANYDMDEDLEEKDYRHNFPQKGFIYKGGFNNGCLLKNPHKLFSKHPYTHLVCILLP